MQELAGYGASDDAYHMTAPDSEANSIILCNLRLLIDDAGLTLDDIHYK